jgi:predicted negative regulator of RcsB-dependent stress response
MAILQTDEPNIIDTETVNWRLIVYPVLLVLIIGVGGIGYYYYLQNQRDQAEATARAALIKATTPAEFLKVADQFPNTDQANLAILRAASASFDAHDLNGALAAYGKIADNAALGADWHDNAELGLAGTLEAMGNNDKAIAAFLEVARRGEKSPYAPFAYNAVARIYEQRGDTQNERAILQEAAVLDPDSAFTRTAQAKLKELAPQQLTIPVPANTAPAFPAPPASAPAPTPPAK